MLQVLGHERVHPLGGARGPRGAPGLCSADGVVFANKGRR